MKKAPQPKEDAPRQIAVAVRSLTPELMLWNTATNELKPVYGGNIAENSVYTPGDMPKDFRIAAEDGNYPDELIFMNYYPLPEKIDEVVLSESPECKLILLNCQPVELPEVNQKRECVVRQMYPTAKVIQMPEPEPPTLPAARKKSKAKAEIAPGTLNLWPNGIPEFNPITKTGTV